MSIHIKSTSKPNPSREQVHPAYTALSEFFDVEFIAYGGASVSKKTKKQLLE